MIDVMELPATSDRTGYLTHSERRLEELAAAAVARAMKLGATAATAYAMERAGITMQNRERRTENAVRSGAQSLQVCVFVDGRTGVAAAGALSPETALAAVENALRTARLVETDEAAGPADPQWLDRSDRNIALFAPSGLSAAALGQAAQALEDEASDLAGGGAIRVTETGASSEDMRWARAIGPDFCRSGSASSQTLWCGVIAENDGRMVSDYWSSVDRRVDHLDAPRTVAAHAIDRVRRKVGARGLSTRSCPVLFDATVAHSLVDNLAGALTGRAQDQKSTFLPDALGRHVLAAHLDLVEDPFEPFGLASSAYDSEGVGSRQRHIVRGGTIEGYFLSSRSARKLGLEPTGNADGPWNLRFTSRHTDAGDDLAAMLRRLDRGLWVTDTMGMGVNPVTGAYSMAVSGIWVEGGVPAFPVEDITIASDLPAMFAGIRHVGADVHRSGRVRTGSILIDTMQVAGR